MVDFFLASRLLTPPREHWSVILSPIDSQNLPSTTSLAIHDESPKDESTMMERATGASVRKILWASATRNRNLAALGTACVSAVVLAGLGFSWFGLAAVGAGMALYSSLIARDALNDDFLCDHYGLNDGFTCDLNGLDDGFAFFFDHNGLDDDFFLWGGWLAGR